MTDVRDASSAYMMGRAQLEKFKYEFETRWYKPYADLLRMQIMRSIKTSPIVNQEKLEDSLSPEALEKLRGA